MTEALNAIARVVCGHGCTYPSCPIEEDWNECKAVARDARAALRAVLPAEPPPEMIEAIAEAEDDEDVYRALRAHMLGEDAA